MLYEKIKELCWLNRITIRKLEQEVGISNGVIRRWENRSPRVDLLLKVADYFGVTVDELIH